MEGYADTVDRAVAGFWSTAAQVVVGTIEEAARRLISRSPIGAPETWKRGKAPPGYVPGNFVSNWNLGINGKDDTVTSATNIRVVNGLANIPADPFGKVFYISNATAHAWPLERGHSELQAPHGMVRITGIELPDIVQEQAAEAKVSGPREMHAGGYGR